MAEGCRRCPHLQCRVDAVRRPARHLDAGEVGAGAFMPVLQLCCTHRASIERAARTGAEIRRQYVTEHRHGFDELVDTYEVALIAEHSDAVSAADVPENSPPAWCRVDAHARVDR